MPPVQPASSRQSRRRVHDNLESRAARAEALVHMGELSAARQALEGAAVAPGNRETLNALQNPVRHPPVLRDPIPQDILHVAPTEQFCLDFDTFTRNIRSARRGAAGGPSGMTAEHLRLILESDSETAAFFRAAQDVPHDVLVLLRMGRLTTLQKPGGGVRVCGDLVRRLVARSIAQQISNSTGGLFTISVRFKHQSRWRIPVSHGFGQSRHSALNRWHQRFRHDIESCDVGWTSPSPWGTQRSLSCSSFILSRLSISGPMTVKEVSKAMPSCPLLCLQDFLLPHEPDDLHVVCLPDRVGPIFMHLKEALDQYAHMQVHLQKTQV